MAKSQLKIDDLQERLRNLLADWGAEVSAFMRALEDQQAQAAAPVENIQDLGHQAHELEKLRRRVHERDLALDHVTKKSREKDVRLTDLEEQHKKARARIDELERRLASGEHQKGGHHPEVEAMRAELDARKSLVKRLRADAERGKLLEKELAEGREVIATMKGSIDRYAKTIEDLRRRSDSWERKYRRLVEAGTKEVSSSDDASSDSDIFTNTVVEKFIDQTTEVDGARTVVIDMTEPLREARDERRKRNRKG